MAVWDNVKNTVEEHPWAVAGGVVALVVLFWFLSSSGGSTASPAPANSDAAAAGLAGSQIAANAATAQAQLAADVQNNQTAAGQAVALAGIQASTDQARIAADAAAAQSNAAIGVATVAAKSQFATDALSAALGFAPGASSTKVPANGGGSAAVTNFKPWELALGDMLFGSQATGTQIAGPVAGETVDPILAKYFGWVGGQQIGGGPSIDQSPKNPNSIFYTPKPSKGAQPVKAK